MHYPSTINHYDHGGHNMTNYTDYDNDIDPNDNNIDYEGIAEMAEDFGYGFRETNEMLGLDDCNYDFDNFGYAD